MNGGTLYVDAWENKPPAIFYLTEFFFSIIPNHVYALFVMSFMTMLALGVCVFYLFYRYFESLSISLVFYAIASYFIIYQNNIGDGLCTEIYGTLCITSSLVFFEHYRKQPSNFILILSGALLGLSPWFKEPFILICMPLLVYYFHSLKSKTLIIKCFAASFIPALLIILLLSLDHSLGAYYDTILYNFHYSASTTDNTQALKLIDYFQNLIQPVLGLSILFLYLTIKNSVNPTTRTESLSFLFLFITSVLFVFVAPYNLGHYYFPSFVLFFVFMAKQYAIFKTHQYAIALPLLIVLLYYIYQIDGNSHPKFSYKIVPFKGDKITERLIADKEATLFVDYVTMSSYYVASDKIHPAFLPVALPVHFDDSEIGKKNRERIWHELSTKPPDYLITTYTTSYCSWHFPETDFYEKNYEKTDSVFPPNENVIYLWKHKRH